MNLQEIVTKRTGKAISQCSNKELYFSLLEMTKGMAEEKVSNEGKRKLYYISAEFLIGKLLSNNLINLGIYDEVKEELAQNGKDICEIEEFETLPQGAKSGIYENTLLFGYTSTRTDLVSFLCFVVLSGKGSLKY